MTWKPLNEQTLLSYWFVHSQLHSQNHNAVNHTRGASEFVHLASSGDWTNFTQKKRKLAFIFSQKVKRRTLLSTEHTAVSCSTVQEWKKKQSWSWFCTIDVGNAYETIKETYWETTTCWNNVKKVSRLRIMLTTSSNSYSIGSHAIKICNANHSPVFSSIATRIFWRNQPKSFLNYCSPRKRSRYTFFSPTGWKWLQKNSR